MRRSIDQHHVQGKWIQQWWARHGVSIRYDEEDSRCVDNYPASNTVFFFFFSTSRRDTVSTSEFPENINNIHTKPSPVSAKSSNERVFVPSHHKRPTLILWNRWCYELHHHESNLVTRIRWLASARSIDADLGRSTLDYIHMSSSKLYVTKR